MQKGSNTPPSKKKPGRSSLPPLLVTPPKGNPFAGLDPGGVGAPAQTTQIPHLTAQVALAKARKERAAQAGLLTPAQRKAEEQAAKTLAEPAPKQVESKVPRRQAPLVLGAPPAPPIKSGGKPSATLPAWLSQPAVSLDQTPPSTPTPATSRLPGGRGALSPRAGMAAATAKAPKGQLLGPLKSVASEIASDPLAYNSGLGLVKAGVAAAKGLGAPIGNTNLTRGVSDVSNIAAEKAAGLQSNVRIPKGLKVEVVPSAGAAAIGRPVTPAELKALEDRGYDLVPRLKKRFTQMALKNGFSEADLDGASGSRTIDMAFSKPASLPLRLISNTASDLAQLGTIPAGVEGAVRETAKGNGAKVGQALTEGLYNQLPVVGNHPVGDMAVAHPFQFFSQFAGAGKTVGAASKLARVGRAGEATERVVQGISRGPLDRNAYTATGQLASDAVANRVPRIADRVRAQQIDDIVRDQVNTHRGPWEDTQRPYKKALDKVGKKRAADLSGYHMAGGKPEQFAAFYRAQGNKGQAKFWDRVAANTKTLSDDDQAFLHAHTGVATKTTQGNIDIEKFGPTAAEFRRYSPLMRSSARLGDPEAQRVLALRDEYVKGFETMPDEDLAALRGAIDQGVSDFAKRHAESGGIEPAYVEYSQPLPVTASPYKPGTGGPTGFKKPRGKQKAETGATFESGNYLIDPKAPLIASIRMQRAHLADALHGVVSKEVGRPVTAGNPLNPGEVFVSETNLRGLRRTVNDLEDNPVSAPDFEELVSRQQGLFDRLKGSAAQTKERVPKGEKGFAIQKGHWNRILDHTRPPSRSSYDKMMQQYQRVLVSYRPSTFVNNAVGSPILASTFGAGPKSYIKAFASGPKRNPEIAPTYLSGGGVAGGLAPNARSKVGTGFDWARFQSQKAEDFSRRAAYMSSALPGSAKRAKELGYTDTNAYLADVAKGAVDKDRLKAGLDRAADALGDSLKPNGKLGRIAGRGILFHNWVGHMAKMILYTLPIEHPRRLTVLNDLANYGDEYRQENGVWPDWYASYLPLFQHVKRVGPAKAAQVFTKAYSTQGFNPFSTLNSFTDPVSTSDGSQSYVETLKDLGLGVANPPIQVLGRTVFDRPYDSHDAGRYLAGQAVRQFPGVSIVRPQGGMAADSIPIFSERQKVYSSGKKRNGKTVPLPFDLRPTARPEPGVMGALERWAFGGVYDIPAQGPIHTIDQRKHIGAAAKNARKRKD